MKKKILIIEDEVVLGDILQKKLIADGFDALWEVDGDAGMQKMRDIRPDLILLDIVMPKKDGYEVLEEMKRDSTLRNIPVIVISNSGQPVELTRILELGAKDYIIKAEFGPEEVVQKVRKYLGEEETQTPVAHTKLSGVKILIVEDDSFLSSLASERFGKEGYAVSVVTDGIQALKSLEKSIPDLILLDMIMPGMNGFEVLKQIKMNPRYDGISIIVFSNLGQEQEVEEAKRLGADDYLIKAQFTLKEVIGKINALLKKKGRL